ncbi:DUF3923 family protein [Lactiplantibacillus herbarum]|uniref:DUF3923 family protein n=1 Tax=Lactiplantibacillus herbarum TaxID=1670446 RepID=UPI00064E3867|nr:DUF3923 family protein [Lactiplantibacillus herbarum]
MKGKRWWLLNGGVGIIVFFGIVLILVRQVDGAGHVETPASRLLAIATLVGFFMLIVVIEVIVHLIIKAFKR